MGHSLLQELQDRQAIRDTVNGYATGIDLRLWDRYRECFAPEIEVDFESWSGAPAQTVSADGWVAGVKLGLSGFAATQHIITNHEIELDGDTAGCQANVQAQHYLPNDRCEDTFTLGGYYTHRLIRTAEGWRIRNCRLTVTWTRGDRALFDLAGQRLAQGGVSS